MYCSYNILLKEKNRLSGEIIVSGGVEEMIKPSVSTQKKAVFHAFMGSRKGVSGRGVAACIKNIKHPVPRNAIRQYGDPGASIVPLGLFYASEDYDERRNFPDADIIVVEGAPVVTSLCPIVEFSGSSFGSCLGDEGSKEIRKYSLMVMSVYSTLYSRREIFAPEIDAPKGSLLSFSYWKRAVRASRLAKHAEKVNAGIASAMADENLEMLIELGIQAKEIAREKSA